MIGVCNDLKSNDDSSGGQNIYTYSALYVYVCLSTHNLGTSTAIVSKFSEQP